MVKQQKSYGIHLSDWCQDPDVEKGVAAEDQTTQSAGGDDDNVSQERVKPPGGPGEHEGGHTAA